MVKNMSITTRVSPEIKESAEKITAKLGMNLSEAISIFLAQLVIKRGLPFEVVIPNDETLLAFEEAEDILSGRVFAKKYSSTDELFEEWEMEDEV